MLERDTRNGVTILRLTHGKVNAFDTELMHALSSELASLANAAGVVLTGAGTIFSAGVDLHRLAEGGRPYVNCFLPAFGDAFLKALTFPRPLVAAVNGHAIAGGCILACACDYRVMAAGAGRIGTPELMVGVPFPSIAIEVLRLVVPPDRLQRLVYLGKTYQPEEALQEGLIDEVVSADALIDRAVDVASRLGKSPSVSFALTKRLIRQPSQDRVTRYARSIDEEVLKAWADPAAQEAVRAYVERTLKKS